MRPAVRLVTVGLIALAAGVTAAGAARWAPRQSGPAATALRLATKAGETQAAASAKNADLVRFSFGDTHFAIPRRYLAGVPQFPGGNEPAFFRLFLTLPDLQPASSEDVKPLMQGHGWGRMLLVWVSYKSPERTGEELLSIILEGVDPKSYRIDQYGSMLYELSRVPHVNEDVHVWRRQNRLFFLTCNRRSPFKNTTIPYSPSCRVREKLWDDIDLDYVYSKNFLHDALLIDQRIQDLLLSFREDANQHSQR